LNKKEKVGSARKVGWWPTKRSPFSLPWRGFSRPRSRSA
jgi:hypothetical protein